MPYELATTEGLHSAKGNGKSKATITRRTPKKSNGKSEKAKRHLQAGACRLRADDKSASGAGSRMSKEPGDGGG